MNIEKFIRNVPDFPKKGIIFKDITPLVGNHAALEYTILQLVKPFIGKGVEAVVGVESRGFIFAPLVAQALGAGFVPVRKPGKLPYKTLSQTYSLEYGVDTVQIHEDAIKAGQKILMVDDLLATGGTMAASCELVKKLGGKIVGAAFVVELAFLHGREKLKGMDVHTLIKVDSE